MSVPVIEHSFHLLLHDSKIINHHLEGIYDNIYNFELSLFPITSWVMMRDQFDYNVQYRLYYSCKQSFYRDNITKVDTWSALFYNILKILF